MQLCWRRVPSLGTHNTHSSHATRTHALCSTPRTHHTHTCTLLLQHLARQEASRTSVTSRWAREASEATHPLHRRGSARGARLPNRAVGPGRTDAEATQTDPLGFKSTSFPEAAVIGDSAHGPPSDRNRPGWAVGVGWGQRVGPGPPAAPVHFQLTNRWATLRKCQRSRERIVMINEVPRTRWHEDPGSLPWALADGNGRKCGGAGPG